MRDHARKGVEFHVVCRDDYLGVRIDHSPPESQAGGHEGLLLFFGSLSTTNR
jgi:hypothetical protein